MDRVALALGCACAGASIWLFRRYTVDDAFITYRIAEHIAGHQGFTYNLGERAQVTTSPLWAVLLALARTLGAPIPGTAMVLSAALLCGAAALLLAAPAGTAIASRGVLGLAALGLVAPNILLLSCLGMETPLYLALLFLTVLAADRRRYRSAGLLAALLVLTRADGVLILPILAARPALRRDGAAWAAVAPLCLVLAGWGLFSIGYFGTPFPVTLQAKVAQGQSGFWGEGPIFLRGIVRYLGGLVRESRALYLMVPLAALGVARGPRSVRLMAIHAAAVTTGYAVLNVPDYHWYYAPLAFALLCAAACGLAALRPAALAWPLLLLLVISNGRTVLARRGMFPLPARADYERCGRTLASAGKGSVAAAEIGVLGYFASRPMCDWVGLACPGSASLLQQRRLDLFLPTFRPDVLVLHEPLWPIEDAVLRTADVATYRLTSVVRGRAGTLALLARGAAPAIGAALAMPGRIEVGAKPVEAGLPPFDPRPYEAMRLEASAAGGSGGRRLEILWLNGATDEYRDPYRVSIDIEADGRPHGHAIPIRLDPRFIAFGTVRGVKLRAEGGPVTVLSLAVGSAS